MRAEPELREGFLVLPNGGRAYWRQQGDAPREYIRVIDSAGAERPDLLHDANQVSQSARRARAKHEAAPSRPAFWTLACVPAFPDCAGEIQFRDGATLGEFLAAARYAAIVGDHAIGSFHDGGVTITITISKPSSRTAR